jgi:hypothetical protein
MDGRPEDLKKRILRVRELQADSHLTISTTEYQLSDLSITYGTLAQIGLRTTPLFCEN